MKRLVTRRPGGRHLLLASGTAFECRESLAAGAVQLDGTLLAVGTIGLPGELVPGFVIEPHPGASTSAMTLMTRQVSWRRFY